MDQDRFCEILGELRGFCNDIIHSLLSSSIYMDDALVKKEVDKDDLRLVDDQISSSIRSFLELRSIILYYTTLLSVGWILNYICIF
jgi:hypothetical protein